MRAQIRNSILDKSTAKLWLLAWVILLFDTHQRFAFGQLRFRYLTQNEGISATAIRSCYADSRGFTWITTESELIRYDGFTLQKYASYSNHFKGNLIYGSLTEDSHGNLLFLTDKGLNLYHRKANRFLSFAVGDLLNFKTAVLAIIGDTVVVYAGPTTYKIASKDLLSKEPIEPNVPNWATYRISQDKFDIRTNQYKKPIADFQDFLADKFFDGKPIKIFHCSYIDDSTLMALTTNGIYSLYLHSNTLLHTATFDGVSLGSISGTLVDHTRKRIWVEGYNQNLLEYDLLERRILKSHHIPNALSDDNIGSIKPAFLDQYDNLYLRSLEGLVITNLRKPKFDHFYTSKNANVMNRSAFIRCISQDKDGNIWCGLHGKGILVFSPKKNLIKHLKIESSEESFDNEVQHILVDSSGKVWVATWHGLYLYNVQNKKFDKINTGNRNLCNYLCQLQDGRILAFFEQEGLFEVKHMRNKYELKSIQISGAELTQIETLIYQLSDGKIFIANHNRILVFEPQSNGSLLFSHLLEIGAKARHFQEDEDRQVIWIATSAGLLKLDPKSFTYKYITNPNPKADNYMYSALPDHRGRLWISTNRGLCRYEPESGKFRNYTVADGLQDWEFNSFAFHRFADGQMWFGGVNGLNAFHPDSIQDFPHLPGIQITAIQVNDKPFSTSNYIGETDSLQFDYEQNTLAFNFVAIELADGKNCPIQYRLVGKDVGWVSISNPGFARYAALAPGEYWLEIKAANSDGVWNPKLKRLYIKIDPPWWKTPWFYCFCVLILFVLIFLIYRYQLQHALAKERIKIETEARERSRISRDLHDRIGSNLGSISFYSEMAQKLQESGPEQMAEILKRIETSSKESVENMADIVWALKPENESFHKIIIRLQNFAAEVLGSKSIDVQFEVDPVLETVIMSLESRTNIYLIAKEALYNAAKYSQATTVEIALKKKENGFLLTITDNGIGFEKKEVEAARNGNGLTNMEQRAKAMNATFSVLSGYGSGTCIKLEGLIL